MKRQFRFPTILGLVGVLLLLIVGALGLDKVTNSTTLASKSNEPKNVSITNITQTGFVVTWTTADSSTGSLVVYNLMGNNQTFYDERDTDTLRLGTYKTHSVPVQTSSGVTTVSFGILSGSKKYLDGSHPYSVNLAPPIGISDINITPAYGTVFTNADIPADGALVYVTIENGQELSTLVKPSGSWLIPLAQARSSDLSSFIIQNQRQTLSIRISFNGDDSTAITDTLNISPVPAMIIGKSYDFRKQQAYQKTSQKPESESVLGIQNDAHPMITSSVDNQFLLTSPGENAALVATRPSIEGRGIPGKTVAITLGISDPTTAQVTIRADGTFQYTPTKPLGSGLQGITVMSVDSFGKPVSIARTFSILKSGTQVLGIATPSGELITATPIPLVPTTLPIATITPELAGQPMPVTASTFPLIAAISVGLIFITSGIFILQK